MSVKGGSFETSNCGFRMPKEMGMVILVQDGRLAGGVERDDGGTP